MVGGAACLVLYRNSAPYLVLAQCVRGGPAVLVGAALGLVSHDAEYTPLALVLPGAGLLAAVHGKPGRSAAQCAGPAGASQFAAWLVSGAAGCGSHQAGRFRHD